MFERLQLIRILVNVLQPAVPHGCWHEAFPASVGVRVGMRAWMVFRYYL
ncbi:MAG: hypothetical protein ACR2LC_10335 [Pyrinomonadaceae bacterium]